MLVLVIKAQHVLVLRHYDVICYSSTQSINTFRKERYKCARDYGVIVKVCFVMDFGP